MIAKMKIGFDDMQLVWNNAFFANFNIDVHNNNQ